MPLLVKHLNKKILTGILVFISLDVKTSQEATCHQKIVLLLDLREILNYVSGAVT